MSNGDQRLFLPWVRRGLAGAITAPLSDATPDLRAAMTVSVDLAVGRDGPSARVTDASRALPVDGLVLMGPGDVEGLGPEIIARTDPPAGSLDMAPNLCPTVEFHAADLPWQFTPAAPDAAQRLLPWLALVCVEEQAEATLRVTDQGRTVLSVTPPEGQDMAGSAGVLPDLSEAWAWAHAQITGVAAEDRITDEGLQHILTHEPHRARSRLICPRNLRPSTSYLCALVPVFEIGRLAGLGQDKPPERLLSWQGDTPGPLDLPVYHMWRFSTAVTGDFEALARRLEARPLGDRAGTRPIDIQRPGMPVPLGAAVIRAPARRDGAPLGPPDEVFPLVTTARTRSLSMGGALRPLGMPAPNENPLGEALLELLEQTETDDGRPIVTPPVYGSWHAGSGGAGLGPTAPAWLRQGSLQTRHRIVAGLGAELVERNKDALMARIWRQYGAVSQVNALLDRARLSRAAGRIVYDRVLGIAADICGATGPSEIIDRLAPVLDRVMAGGETVGERLDHDGLRPASPAQRRAERAAPAPAKGSKADIRRARADRLRQPADPRPGEDLPAPEPDVARVIADLQAPGSFAATPSPDWPGINAALCAGLAPETTVPRRTHARLGPGVTSEIPGNDPLGPVIAAPSLDWPVAPELLALSQDWMLPGLDRLPQNALALLVPDRAFIEAVMAGANHALNAEMLWRGFPTDRSATVLRRFWEGSDADIAPMTGWTGALGEHPDPGGRQPSLMLVIRGDLLRRFPETLIYAAPASGSAPDDLFVARTAVPRLPLFQMGLGTDVTVLAFDLTEAEIQATSHQPGWFFMLEGPVSQPKFGLDETLDFEKGKDAARSIDTLTAFDWDPTYWGDLLDPFLPEERIEAALEALTHIPVEAPANPTLRQAPATGARAVAWGANAAHMAAICLQRDTRLALHANALFGGPVT